jgi:hypothetical protein
MYENGEMRPGKLFQEWGIKENEGGGKFNYDVL